MLQVTVSDECKVTMLGYTVSVGVHKRMIELHVMQSRVCKCSVSVTRCISIELALLMSNVMSSRLEMYSSVSVLPSCSTLYVILESISVEWSIIVIDVVNSRRQNTRGIDLQLPCILASRVESNPNRGRVYHCDGYCTIHRPMHLQHPNEYRTTIYPTRQYYTYNPQTPLLMLHP